MVVFFAKYCFFLHAFVRSACKHIRVAYILNNYTDLLYNSYIGKVLLKLFRQPYTSSCRVRKKGGVIEHAARHTGAAQLGVDLHRAIPKSR